MSDDVHEPSVNSIKSFFPKDSTTGDSTGRQGFLRQLKPDFERESLNPTPYNSRAGREGTKNWRQMLIDLTLIFWTTCKVWVTVPHDSSCILGQSICTLTSSPTREGNGEKRPKSSSIGALCYKGSITIPHLERYLMTWMDAAGSLKAVSGLVITCPTLRYFMPDDFYIIASAHKHSQGYFRLTACLH